MTARWKFKDWLDKGEDGFGLLLRKNFKKTKHTSRTFTCLFFLQTSFSHRFDYGSKKHTSEYKTTDHPCSNGWNQLSWILGFFYIGRYGLSSNIEYILVFFSCGFCDCCNHWIFLVQGEELQSVLKTACLPPEIEYRFATNLLENSSGAFISLQGENGNGLEWYPVASSISQILRSCVADEMQKLYN